MLERIMSDFVSSLRKSSAVETGTCAHRAPSRPPFKTNGHLEHPHTQRILSMEADRIRGASAQAIFFGRFCLLPAQQLLLHEDVPVPLGGRAMDILIALVERAGELVSKAELMARVWPNTFVAPANLTVQLCAVRRALGDGRDGNRFVINISGRGYQFVAPVTFAQDMPPFELGRKPREHASTIPDHPDVMHAMRGK
jgi:DNA-binding winged helix-turn-helix (wHTH) protein